MSDDQADERQAKRSSDAEIEEQVRALYGGRLKASQRVHRFGEDALYDWPGRSIVMDSADVIILAEASRATKPRSTDGVARFRPSVNEE
jgi:hypothetical protein